MIAVFLYFTFNNFFKRFRFTENRLFILAGLSSTALYSIILLQVLNINPDFTYMTRIYFGLIIFSFQIIVAIFHIFPSWEKRSGAFFIVFSQLPGLFLIIVSLLTDKIVIKTDYIDNLTYTFGNPVILYASVFAFYILIFLILMAYKLKTVKNINFKDRLIHITTGLLSGVIIFVVLFIILPVIYDNFNFTVTGLAVIGFIPAFVINYYISDDKYHEVSYFYLKTAVWLFYILGLLIPAYLFFNITAWIKLSDNRILLIIASVVLSIYFFLFFYLLKPVGDKIINKKDRELTSIFADIINNISHHSNINKQLDWNIFFKQGIDYFCNKLSVAEAYFFLNINGSSFELIHEFNSKSKILQLSEKHTIIQALVKYRQIIEKSLIFTDLVLKQFRSKLLNFFTEHDLQICLPVFSDNGKLKAVFNINKYNTGKLFPTRDYIHFLENYGLHLKILLEKILFSEEVRKTQISKRDKLIIKNIKRRIIPAEFQNINGMQISSIFIDNSEFGGDCFNTIKISDTKSGIFAANTSDMGIESALLAVQINSVFQSQAKSYESPDILLNNINQVLYSSRFTDKYATSIYMIYDSSTREISFSNAAFNPLLIYNPNKDVITEFDVEGIPIGIDMTFRYKNRILFAPVNSIGLLYSNGLASAINEQGNNYSVSRLKDIIKINKNDSPDTIVKKIYNDFNSFIHGNALLNDVSVIVFRVE